MQVTGRHSPDFYRCENCANVWWIPKPDQQPPNGADGNEPDGPN